MVNDLSLFGIKASECFTADDDDDDVVDDISEQVFLLLQYFNTLQFTLSTLNTSFSYDS